MEPKLWGRGAWLIIFARIYYFIKIMNEINYDYEIEKLKKTLLIICTHLPCHTCSYHSLNHITNNSIMSEKNINRILHFFIELYNSFHEDSIIDRLKIKTYKAYI
jgi:deoxycytidylate deaminase